MTVSRRAYSLLNIKSTDDDKRIITGIASTPSTDLKDDIVEPKGAEFHLPIPFLWQHDSRQPVGHVTKAKVTANGIEVEVQLKKTNEPGPVKDRLDSAWQDIKLGLVRGLSIGFKEIEIAEIKGSDGIRFLKWLWLELSAVTIAANQDASILAIKQIDTAVLAATGHKHSDDVTKPAGASATKSTPVVKAQEGRRAMSKKTVAEQIAGFEATRVAKSARMDAIMDDSADNGTTLDAAEKEEYDGLENEVKEIDDHLVRLRVREKANVAASVPAVGSNPDEASKTRAGVRVEVKSAVPESITFTRIAIAKAIAAKEMLSPLDVAQQRWPNQPELYLAIKAAVTPGSSSTMAAMVEPSIYSQGMIEYLWHKTILGRIPGLRRVPFNTKVQRALTVASVNWVGEGKPKPLGRGTLDTVTLGYTKIAGIVPLTDELVRFSTPSAEAMVRDQLAGAIVQLMDHDFLDPEKAVVANVSPASITNTATGVSATGTAYANVAADVGTAMANFDAARIDTSDLVVVMGSRQARMLSLMLNSLGQKLFPDLTMTTGTFLGYPVIVSGNVDYTEDSPAEGDNIFFIKPSDILVADDGGVDIAISREAAVQMDSAPDDPASASTVLISAFQHNLVLIRAERYVNWLKARDAAVQYIKAAKYA